MFPLCVLFPALLIPAALAAAELPIVAISLSSAGLAEIERRGPVPARESIRFRAPVTAIDDILRTLVVSDPAGRVAGLSLSGPDLETEAFRDLPVKPEDFSSRAALLQALRGQIVTASGVTGRLADAETAPDGLRLTLIVAEGLRVLPLPAGEAIQLLDASLADRLNRAAAMLAASRQAESREIEVALTGAEMPRDVSLTYLAGAPIWKPSWRILLPAEGGPIRLQGWAVVENRTGTDWSGINLTLVSGNPAAYRQALFTPIEVDRPERPVRTAERLVVTADSGPRPPPPSIVAAAPARLTASATPLGRAAPTAMAADEAASQLIVPQVETIAGEGRLAYRLPVPISLSAGATANFLFLDNALPAERVWWMPVLHSTHPLNALRLQNATASPLPDGLAALFGPTGYLGDAELRWLPPGQNRLLGYARDRTILSTAQDHRSETPIAAANRRTAVEVTMSVREETAIAIEPAGAKGSLLIDLPRRSGAEPRFATIAQGDFGLRVEATLSGMPTTLRYAWEHRKILSLPLWEPALGDPMRLDWRGFDLEAKHAALPGGAATLDRLTKLLRDLPPDASGRAGLEQTILLLQRVQQRLDAARGAVARARVTSLALERARQAAEDRSGPAREEARRQLNAASLAAEEAGRAADTAWLAWRSAVEMVLERPEG